MYIAQKLKGLVQHSSIAETLVSDNSSKSWRTMLPGENLSGKSYTSAASAVYMGTDMKKKTVIIKDGTILGDHIKLSTHSGHFRPDTAKEGSLFFAQQGADSGLGKYRALHSSSNFNAERTSGLAMKDAEKYAASYKKRKLGKNYSNLQSMRFDLRQKVRKYGHKSAMRVENIPKETLAVSDKGPLIAKSLLSITGIGIFASLLYFSNKSQATDEKLNLVESKTKDSLSKIGDLLFKITREKNLIWSKSTNFL